MKLNKRLKAICFMVISSILFTTMNLLSRLASGTSLYQKAFISNITAFLIISAVVLRNRISFIGNKKNRKYLIIRGLCGTLSLAALYYTLDHMILSDATMISKLGPSFAVVFGYIILKDKINKKQIIFLLLTLAGAVLIIKPSISFSIIPSVIGLSGAACAGIAFTMIRLLGDSENKFTIILYNIVFACVLSLPFIFLNIENYNNIRSIIYSILAGLCIAFGQICLTSAYKNAPASSIAMYDYVGLLVSAFYGVILFNEIPDYLSIIGYIIISGIAIINFFICRKTSQ
ncbi:DMT family transporter [uncultured Clostridium sp.]|uniref:DMT family transporter n=1 Tax=uncultured Clostridium sp. TaxID=59620 RepID=UPI0025F05B54|nr:DMT family transporter [uncultured Clostridium sp.]